MNECIINGKTTYGLFTVVDKMHHLMSFFATLNAFSKLYKKGLDIVG